LPTDPSGSRSVPADAGGRAARPGRDIRKNGLREGISLLDGKLIDGRNRLDAMEIVGLKLLAGNGQPDWTNIPFRNVKGRLSSRKTSCAVISPPTKSASWSRSC
jgi:hypothetical protein